MKKKAEQITTINIPIESRKIIQITDHQQRYSSTYTFVLIVYLYVCVYGVIYDNI